MLVVLCCRMRDMRRNIGILVFFLVLTAPIFCQDEKQPDCPKISVSGPSGLPLISTDGVIFDFDASIEDPHPEIIGFSWIATGGDPGKTDRKSTRLNASHANI